MENALHMRRFYLYIRNNELFIYVYDDQILYNKKSHPRICWMNKNGLPL